MLAGARHGSWQGNESALSFGGSEEVFFKDLSPQLQKRFSIDTIRQAEDAYHASVQAGDRVDRARQQERKAK